MNLFKYDHHTATNEFLGPFLSHKFLLYILQPTRISSNSKTLIDDIFPNILSPDSVSGNLAATISDHLP